MSDLHEHIVSEQALLVKGLRREVAEMKAARDNAVGIPEWEQELANEEYTLRVLEAFEPMRAALEEFGEHDTKCKWYAADGIAAPRPESDCDCGLTAALRAAREASTQ